jgi:hypothetical protein
VIRALFEHESFYPSQRLHRHIEPLPNLTAHHQSEDFPQRELPPACSSAFVSGEYSLSFPVVEHLVGQARSRFYIGGFELRIFQNVQRWLFGAHVAERVAQEKVFRKE